ncbi:hypothetical protein FB561_4342 [Kribbella amoyensis]|uniref:Uncharacterized protein n=1 Tax=Kribbella amoyensis TaxID=996641 RepID=A0A561BWH2_9ACTN|nr:hypothetical protein [Kribbella amoyensis]TWD83183.1 hypothetical protein FB561_4342 [Kribbella amoyensis]
MDDPHIETEPSLRGYLELYAAGFVEREEMLSAVAAWPFQQEDHDEGRIEPSHQDNTLSVVSGARLLGQLTREDVEEIQRRMSGPLF